MGQGRSRADNGIGSRFVVHRGEVARIWSDRLTKLYCWSAFLLLSGALTHLFGPDRPGAAFSGTSRAFLPVAMAFYSMAVLGLLRPACVRSCLVYCKSNALMIIALMLTLVSALWSIDPSETLRRGIALLGTTVVGIFLGITFRRRDMLGFLRHALAAFVIASVALAIFVPALGTHVGGKFDGLWRGLMSFKNQMGWMAALFLVLWVSQAKVSSLRQPAFVVPLFFGLLLLAKTSSATGVLVAVFGVTALFALRVYQSAGKNRAYIIIGCILILCAVLLVSGTVVNLSLDLVGRDASLTGRTTIWKSVWPFIEERWWLGYGYSAFWPNSVHFFGPLNWLSGLNHAHNSYIETLLDLGLLGAVTQGAVILGLTVRLLRLSQLGDKEASAYLALLLSCFVIGLSGAVFFRPNTGTWLMIVMISVYASALGGSVRENGARAA